MSTQHTFASPPESVTDARPDVDAYVPAFSLRQGKDAFVIQALLPGVKPDDLEIEARDGWLNIRGRRSEDDRTDFHTFDQSYVLPPEIDRTSIHATHKRGLLTVVMRIPASWKTRRFPVAT